MAPVIPAHMISLETLLHSESMFPFVESGGSGGSDDPSGSFFFFSVVIMPSGLQLGVNVPVTDDTFTPRGNVAFAVLVVTRWSQHFDDPH